jgi:hypothetical protein
LFFLNTPSNKEKKALYEAAVTLPYCEYLEDYNISMTLINNSDFISEAFKEELEDRDDSAPLWARCFTKAFFTASNTTTSRIEYLHGFIKKFLNENSKLTQIFHLIADIDKKEFLSSKEIRK